MAYSSMIQVAQSTIRNLIYDNRTDPYGDIKVLDGNPQDIMKGTGYSFVIVQTPTTNEERLTMGHNPIFKNTISVSIEIWSRRESSAREISDMVRNILKTQQATTRAVDMVLYNIERSDMATGELPSAGKPTVYTITLLATYDWYGA